MKAVVVVPLNDPMRMLSIPWDWSDSPIYRSWDERIHAVETEKSR